MPDLDYGYEVTIAQNATSDPAASSVTNQWQKRVVYGNPFEDIQGETGETYTVSPQDQGCKIRLKQNLDGSSAISNELQVTRDPYIPAWNLIKSSVFNRCNTRSQFATDGTTLAACNDDGLIKYCNKDDLTSWTNWPFIAGTTPVQLSYMWGNWYATETSKVYMASSVGGSWTLVKQAGGYITGPTTITTKQGTRLIIASDRSPLYSDNGTNWFIPGPAAGESTSRDRWSIASDGDLKVVSFGQKKTSSSTSKAHYSLDGGETWTANPNADGLVTSYWGSAVVYFKDAFYLISDTKKVYKSINAIDWTLVHNGVATTEYVLTATKTDKTLVATALVSNANRIFYSDDGMDWRQSEKTLQGGHLIMSMTFFNNKVLALTNNGYLYQLKNVP